MTEDVDRIAELVSTIGEIPPVAADRDIYDAGFSSIDALNLLVELETTFDVSIPDDAFVNARTTRSLAELISDLRARNA